MSNTRLTFIIQNKFSNRFYVRFSVSGVHYLNDRPTQSMVEYFKSQGLQVIW